MLGCAPVESNVQLGQHPAEKVLAFWVLASKLQLESVAVLDRISQCLLALVTKPATKRQWE